MRFETTGIEGLGVLYPDRFSDERGSFQEVYQFERYRQAGIPAEFVQDNLSVSRRGVLRGLHFQSAPFEQAKLVQVLQGEIYDVTVDIRKNSPTFGQVFSILLSGEDPKQLFMPRGCAHGFCVLSSTAAFYYKCDNYYSPDHERGILWSDPQLSIKWPLTGPILSERDNRLPLLAEIPETDLPD